MNSFGRGKKPGNVWNNSHMVGRPTTNKKTNLTSTENKFREAQLKLQAAVEKYTKDYESSSSEDELETENVIGSILKNYAEIGGKSENLARTQTFLEDSLASGAATCLICIGSIKRIDKIWSCTSCYCFFHLLCIERWSKDSVTQQKEQLREQPQIANTAQIKWGCPKCRFEYTPEQIPREYKCFCEKFVNPAFQPWLVPHSCGEICGKKLKPLCGHECKLLCHPGPCPPCPQTVKSACYCGKKPPKLQRCSNKEWSCRLPCKKTLSCGKHQCFLPCHAGECKPCSKQSVQKCECGDSETLRNCASPVWQCAKVCNRPLSCGYHNCPEICHKQPCGECALSKPRSCPCGKTTNQLPCTDEVPACGDTCGKILECGAHTCNQRCHKDKCGTCLELVVKSCRCGLHQKEVQCKKPYLCDTKCKNIRDCYRHPCNRKCCDGNCPSCEKPCGRTLLCGIHKCTSVCHRGPCYPCMLTEEVKCRCGATVLTVPCGRKKRTRPPKCFKPCEIAPDCHHEKRESHRCHFGDCPPCRQICMKSLRNCSHSCPSICHSYVLVKVEAQKASMPWEQMGPFIERKALPCPECVVPVSVTCLGGHETCDWSCHLAKSSSCQRSCGRQLACGNHRCELACHIVEGAENDVMAGTNCEVCEHSCSVPRPEGCPHPCPLQCHPGSCPPCKHMFRLKCHCGLNQPYVRCSEWISSSDKEQLQSCGNQCPKNYDCGHRCRANCHSGSCPNSEQCKKKVKITCPCRRLKKEFSCEVVRNNAALVECDEVCDKKKEEERKQREIELEVKKREEELRNAKELEQFQKKFQGKKKNRDKRRYDEVEEISFVRKYWYFMLAFLILLISLYFVIG